MPVQPTPLNDAFIYKPTVFGDERGYFFESFNSERFAAETGLAIQFVQDNQAFSSQHVLRGLHFQKGEAAQSKLVRVLQGRIYDVIVDLRNESSTFGQWFGIELSRDNFCQLFVPKGFGHGYAVLSDTAEVFYKCDAFYNKAEEDGILYNDPSLNIDWQMDIAEAIVSEKDQIWPIFDSTKKYF